MRLGSWIRSTWRRGKTEVLDSRKGYESRDCGESSDFVHTPFSFMTSTAAYGEVIVW